MSPNPEAAAVRLFRKLMERYPKEELEDVCDSLIIAEGDILHATMEALKDADYSTAAKYIGELELISRFKPIACAGIAKSVLESK